MRRGPWWHCPHHVVGSGICPLEQDLPSALQVWHRGDGFPQGPFFLRSFNEMCCSDPMGVPNTVIPTSCHTSSPSSSMALGGIPARFQALVFPWVPPTHTTFTRDTRHPRTRTTTSSNAPWDGEQERHERVGSDQVGQTKFGQIQVWPNPSLAKPLLCCCLVVCWLLLLLCVMCVVALNPKP